jgi:DNA polymerase I
MNRLVLIDGNAMLHRAYHAIPVLNTPDGKPVNAVYGFATMLFKLSQNLQPAYMAVAFDRPKPTFRKKLFKAYQSKRPKMDDALASQIAPIHELVEAFGIPIFEQDGFEADDVIGTLATVVTSRKRLETSKLKNKSQVSSPQSLAIDQVIIVTGDRDILQLVVDDKVLVYMPTKGISEGKIYAERDVKERLGVNPSQITDFKGLAGDNSDNYPGVAGIGPKTAIALIETFGTVEKLYAAIAKKDARINLFSAGVIEKLKTGEKEAKLFKDIATIRLDVPVEFELPLSLSFDGPLARAFLEKMQFHSLLKRVNGSAISEKNPAKKEAVESQKKEEVSNEQQALF